MVVMDSPQAIKAPDLQFCVASMAQMVAPAPAASPPSYVHKDESEKYSNKYLKEFRCIGTLPTHSYRACTLLAPVLVTSSLKHLFRDTRSKHL
ncbi:hypothetical protein EVAR_24305_1 [Eumeta japonica]|uniref:Uncharacterized protein n=1 Tax=Eumeta variegata TaxID=151549 RepID=A0A4C1VNH8_EUMVA|nr:hypothetical protein EVAR_24305_1 [Eumeta japonica]